MVKEFHIQTKHLYSLNFLNGFRKEFLKNITNLLNNTKNNNNNFFKVSTLKKTIIDIKNKQLTVTKADKNIGIILINTNLYNNLCIEHLINDDTYDKIDMNPQFYIYNKAKLAISDL